MKFYNWLLNEYKIDLNRMFGEPGGKEGYSGEDLREEPIHTINIEYISEELSKKTIGFKEGKTPFIGQNLWGEGHGSLQCTISPKNFVYIKKASNDLKGNLVWITKRTYLIDRSGMKDDCEPVIIDEIATEMEIINSEPADPPVGDYDRIKFQYLVQELTQTLVSKASSIFVFQRLKKITDERYIIEFELRGAGVEAPGHQQIAVNLIEINYLPERGLIKIFDTNASSKTGRSKNWELGAAESNFYFSPSQPNKEIVEAMETTLKDY